MLEHCGFVTLVGRSNVGKSTLLNRLIGQKISITSRKPQTTRSHLLGIKSNGNSQILYVDTPGLQKKSSNLISRYMNREIFNALVDVDVVVHVIEAMKWNQTDHEIMTRIQNTGKPLILAINKIDKIDEKSDLLPFIDKIEAASNYIDIIPLSAKTGKNIDLLEEQITRQLPPGEKQYPDDQISNRNERYFAAEFIREKLTRQLGDEVPYNISVVIDRFSEDERIITIHATIWVATSGQKRIVIGKGGEILKKIGIQARKDMEKMFGKKVFLETWVKIKEKWMTNPNALKQFGYEN
ncbi:MAG TPA: GTPase Era [Gammaproteobacteria bacterium]